MKILTFAYPDTPQVDEPLTLCLGYFDGVHLGHQSLINKAKENGLKVGVFSFSDSPAYVLGKIKENHCVSSNSDKAEYLEHLGVDYFFLMDFDLEASKVTKEEFTDKVLKIINPQKIYVGEDFRFGYLAQGSGEYLKQFFDVEIMHFINDDEVKISTRDIISYIENGEMEKVKKQLGRYYRINGLVVEGKHNGRKIDFPTANLKLDFPYAFPKIGAYIGYAYVGETRYKAIVSVGTHPTIMQLLKPIIEVHLLDYDGDLYGKDIFVEFVKYLREEKVFASVDELKEQLTKDKKVTKRVLKILEERENNQH